MIDSVCAGKKKKKALWKIPECVKGQGETAAGESFKTSGLRRGVWGWQTGKAT